MNKTLKTLLCAAGLAAMASAAMAETPTLPPCKTGARSVTLTIKTDTSSGWTVNGAPVTVVSNPGWGAPSGATWIGPSGGTGPGTLTYKITFSAPTMHGAMSVQAKWMADNCGTSLKAGSSAAVPASSGCFMSPSPNGRDFLAFNHVTNASFSPGDVNDPNPSLTFTVANQPGSATGLAGVFTVTALCVCRDS